MNSEQILATLPHSPGIYLFKNKKGDILYIGKAKNLKKRVSQYFSPNSVRKQDMLNKAHHVDFFTVNTESEALYLEDNLIKTHQPPFNNLLKGANSYSYIKITNEPIPRIFITRKKIKDGATYIGPKHNTHALKKLLYYLRQVLKFRTCNTSEFNKKGYCNDYYFGMCEGRGKKWRENPEKTEFEYQKLLKIVIKFFKGDTSSIKTTIKEKITFAVEQENFERAARLRDVYHSIENLTEKQSVVLSRNYNGVMFLIKKVSTWYLVGSINFFEGKIVDIVVNKFCSDDVDQAHLITLFENEFGNFYFHEWNQDMMGYQKRQVTKLMLQEGNVLLNNAIESYMIASARNKENIFNDLLANLQERYQLKFFPYHIECIDISHLSGSRISGGLSAMIGGILNKKYYRNYNIKTVSPTGNQSDDYQSLKEVIIRRFLNEKNTENNLSQHNSMVPNLFILDGGKGQLNIVKKLLTEEPNFKNIFKQIDFVALGKGAARKQSNIGKYSDKDNKNISEYLYYFDEHLTITSQPLQYDSTDEILIKLRNEAHRFSNRYRKKQMSKEWK